MSLFDLTTLTLKTRLPGIQFLKHRIRSPAFFPALPGLSLQGLDLLGKTLKPCPAAAILFL